MNDNNSFEQYNEKLDIESLLKIKYGIYIVTSVNDGYDCGCIINTVEQVTHTVPRISVTINKQSYTCKTIEKSGIFNASVLTRDTDYDIIVRFGFNSSKDYNKFERLEFERAENGAALIKSCANAVYSASVEKTVDLDTHIIFIARLTEAITVSDKPTLSYNYYQENIKPKN